MIEDYAIDAWLGPAREDLTDDQRDEFARIVRAYENAIEARPGERADYQDEDDAVWRAALEHVEGALDVPARGRAYRAAKDDAYAGAIVAHLAGAREVDAAADATISRATLRKALWKKSA